jgi:hypothetical protein
MAKRKTVDDAPAAVAELVDETVDEVALVKADAGIVSSFLGGMAKFFSGATALEKAAATKLEDARKLRGRALTSAAQDEAIQRMVKGASADIKGVEEYWDITAKVSQLHKRLVAGRQRPVAMLEEVKAIGNALHNTWTDSERRRVAAENERKRIEAEAAAEAERDRELLRAEAAAVKAEQQSPELSPRELVFVSQTLNGIAPTKAAVVRRLQGSRGRRAAAPGHEEDHRRDRGAADGRRDSHAGGRGRRATARREADRGIETTGHTGRRRA